MNTPAATKQQTGNCRGRVEDTSAAAAENSFKRIKTETAVTPLSLSEFRQNLSQALKASRGRNNALSNCGHLTNRALGVLRSLLKTGVCPPELLTPVTTQVGGAHTTPTFDLIRIKEEHKEGESQK